MSKVCLCVLHRAKEQYNEIKSQIDPLFNKHSIFLFGEIGYHEPFFDVIDRKDSMILSISDNSFYDNCELLLLPDNCKINEMENSTPFHQRMSTIQDMLKKMSEYCDTLELFVGDSGCGYNEYEKLQTNISDFLRCSKRLNSPTPPNIHYTFTPVGQGDELIIPTDEG